MTRSAEAISPETMAVPATASHVCPFCGTVTDRADEPCRRCSMENTPLTRQATRARIGPWYVMQSRNPAAPGMKHSTLLALIRKGQVTARSVIRGPTTHQLWRFAARVKGISREFGLCYSCGAQIQKTTTTCPRCSRAQDLPANPNLLLESESSSKAVYREIAQHGREDHGGARADDALPMAEIESPAPPTHGANQSHPRTSPPPERPQRPPSPAGTMAAVAGIASPENAPPGMQSRARQQPLDRMLTAKDLAAAFSLQFNPRGDPAPVPPRRERHWGAVVTAIIVLGLIGAGIAVWVNPIAHEKVAHFVRELIPPSSAMGESSSHGMTKSALPAVAAPPVEPQAEPPSQPAAQTPAAPIAAASPIASPPASTIQLPSPAPAPAANAAAEQSVVPSPSASHAVAPAPSSAPPSESTLLAPAAPANTASASVSAPLPEDQTQNQELVKNLTSSSRDPDTLAMQLRANGLDCEARHDYAGAEYFYEQIEKMPRVHWPADTDQLLQAARKRAQAAGGF